MRKAKLYALTLAAVMAVGSAPVYTYGSPAEEVSTESETTEEPGETPENSPEAEQPEESAEQAASEEEPEEEQEASEDENGETSPTVTETPEGEEKPETTPGAGSETQTGTKTITLKKDNLTSVLEEIKTAQEKEIVLEVAKEVEVKSSCEIKPAEGKTLTVKRHSGYTGNMFKVASGATLTVSGVKMDGSVSAADSSAKGGAVIYSSGKVILRDCTISGNASDSGAVYLTGSENILSGSLSITGNKAADKKTEKNLYLAEGASFKVDSAWKEGSKVGVTSAKTDAGTLIYKIEGTNVASVNSYVTCENAGLTIQYDEAKKEASLAAAATPTPTVPAQDTYDATKHKEQNTISGLKKSYVEAERMIFQATGAGLDREEPKAGDTAYVPTDAILEGNTTGKRYSIENFGVRENGGYEGSANLRVEADNYTLTVYYELRQWGENTTSWEDAETAQNASETDKTATASQTLKVTAAPATGYDATQHTDENQILGVSSSYKQNSRLSFTIEGAGLDREEPKAGDTAYVPTSSILTCSDGKRYSIAVNNEGGEYSGNATLSKSKVPTGDSTLTVYYELRQWTDGIDSWADAQAVNLSEAGNEEVTASKTFRVTAASTTTTTKKSSASAKKSSSKSSSTSKAKNAKTADETPILPLAGLCAASVLAGGLVITRKRKLDQK